LSQGLPRWRTGAILQFEDNRALVKADPAEKKVFISVSGPVPGRRRLLAIIRSDFERIHHDIPRLDPAEMVPVPGHPESVISYKKLQVLEANGETELTEVIGNKVIKPRVQELLNGVDLPMLITASRPGSGKEFPLAEGPVRLFYSYSHKDEEHRRRLETHLKLLHRQGLIVSWHDRLIEAGDDWKNAISTYLEQAGIILLLVSADFLASDYCYDIEMKRALERAEAGEAVVIPIIVRNVAWTSAPFAKLQSLPTEGKAVTSWSDPDSAWREISEGIARKAQDILKKRQKKHDGQL
jgi:internalin A